MVSDANFKATGNDTLSQWANFLKSVVDALLLQDHSAAVSFPLHISDAPFPICETSITCFELNFSDEGRINRVLVRLA